LTAALFHQRSKVPLQLKLAAIQPRFYAAANASD
jgi:hypothetical protein